MSEAPKRFGPQDLARMIAVMESGKEQVNIAQIQEILARLADYAFAYPAPFHSAWGRLLELAQQRYVDEVTQKIQEVVDAG